MLLITGVTGLVGRPLVEHLPAGGAAVRAVTRDPATDDLLGRPARAFAQWAREHADGFAGVREA